MSLLTTSACPADLAHDLVATRSNISNHLACLRRCGRVPASREGRQIRFELASKPFADGLRTLARLDLAVEPVHPHFDGREHWRTDDLDHCG